MKKWKDFTMSGRSLWSAKPYPNLAAISNVFQLAVRRDPDIAGYNPLALWNTHFVPRTRR
jgi:hypothetical protein